MLNLVFLLSRALRWFECDNSNIPHMLFLSQHPALTAGQRRYLCSIANVYSTEHMRQQMKQHYLNVLHTCVQSGVYLNVSNGNFDHYHPSHVVFCISQVRIPPAEGGMGIISIEKIALSQRMQRRMWRGQSQRDRGKAAAQLILMSYFQK